MALSTLMLEVVGRAVSPVAALAVSQPGMVHRDGSPISGLMAIGTLTVKVPFRLPIFMARLTVGGIGHCVIES